MKLALITAAALLATGCAITETPTRVEQPLPPRWNEPLSADTGLPPAAPPTADWWRAFGSPTLDALVDEGLAGSSDLRVAGERVRQAELALQLAGVARLPVVGLSAGTGSTRSQSPGVAASERRSSSAALAIDYELDLWGRVAAGVQAQDALLQASRFDLDAARLSVSAAIASSYFELLAARERLRIARENLTVAERVLRVVEARQRNGVATTLELSQQRSTVLAQRSALIPLELAERQTLTALALLLGRVPLGYTLGGEALYALQPPALAAGLPAALLTRRPDLASAEAQLASADADVAAARAALLPSVGLSASAGLATSSWLSLANPASTLSLGASLAQTIFDGGQRRAQVALSQSARRVLVETYAAAVRTALKEVDDGLGNVERNRRQALMQADIVEQARQTLRLAELRYREGSDDLLTVLDAQRTLFAAQDTQAGLQRDRLVAAVDLAKALGGGWQRGSVTP